MEAWRPAFLLIARQRMRGVGDLRKEDFQCVLLLPPAQTHSHFAFSIFSAGIGECANDPKAAAVRDRIADITGIPENYAESLQLLRYTEGQFCKW